ncbi:hypothetical protein [Salinigranum halophilum]|uniref:hypothetical protein n=1 Tax=Salinigranum halophilum TaxID=2565931 RepID=UPI00374495CD
MSIRHSCPVWYSRLLACARSRVRVCLWIGLVTFGLLTRPVRAQQTNSTPTNSSPTGSGGRASDGTDGGALSEAIVEGLTSLLTTLFSPVEGLIENHVHGLLQLLVSTPHPETVFGEPQTAPWDAIHAYYWETVIPLALLVFGLAVGVVILLESTSHLFSGFHRAHLKRRAFVGLLGVLSWWWIAAFSLQLTDQLARFIMPDLSSISLFQTLSFSSIGLLGILVSLSVDLVIFILIALIYFIRQLVLYGFVLGMPLLMVCWIPGVGPFRYSSRFAQRLASFYVPFLFMVIPVALLFRLGGLLGRSATVSFDGFGQWLTALVIPVVAVVSPFILVWQAGAIFFVAENMSRHASGLRARERAAQLATHGATAAQTGRNATRGLRDEPPIRSDGQLLLDSGGASSRGYRLGSGLRSSASSLRERFSSSATTSRLDTTEHSSRWTSTVDAANGIEVTASRGGNEIRSGVDDVADGSDTTRVSDSMDNWGDASALPDRHREPGLNDGADSQGLHDSDTADWESLWSDLRSNSNPVSNDSVSSEQPGSEERDD